MGTNKVLRRNILKRKDTCISVTIAKIQSQQFAIQFIMIRKRSYKKFTMALVAVSTVFGFYRISR